MRKPTMAILAAVAAPQLLGSGAPPANSLKAVIAKLGGAPCSIGSLTCVKIKVPVDHRANRSPTTDIEFAVSFASGASKGVPIYVVGGPGGSGLAVADDYL